jgi:hypothetical protein
VNGAEVAAQLGMPDCAAAATTVSAGLTDPDSRYRMIIHGPGDDRSRCLRACATPPAGSLHRASDTIAFTLQFTGGMRDGARVDLVLRVP